MVAYIAIEISHLMVEAPRHKPNIPPTEAVKNIRLDKRVG